MPADSIDSVFALRGRRQALLRQWHATLADSLARVQKSYGVEAIHNARVGARRLRVVLQGIGRDSHPLLLDPLLFDLRDLGRALAPVRDADVRKHHLAALLRRFHDEFKSAGAHVLAAADSERSAARNNLKRLIRAPTWKLRLQRLATHVQDEGLLALPRIGAASPEQSRLERHLDSIRKQLKKKSWLKHDLHTLRIKTKRARYLTEFLADLETTAATADSAHLKALQSTLGDLHDYLQLDSWFDEINMNTELRVQLHDAVRAQIDRRYEQLAKIRGQYLDAY